MTHSSTVFNGMNVRMPHVLRQIAYYEDKKTKTWHAGFATSKDGTRFKIINDYEGVSAAEAVGKVMFSVSGKILSNIVLQDVTNVDLNKLPN